MSTRPIRARSLGLLLAAASMAAALTPAAAETPRAVRKACTSDAKRLCPREKADSPEMNYCMEAKAKQFSRNCVRALEDAGMVPRGYLSKN